MECSSCSKTIQTERLLEARQTGAEMLITAGPKCWIHLICAKQGEKIDLEVKGLYTFIEERLSGNK